MRPISSAAQCKGLCLIRLCINFIIDANRRLQTKPNQLVNVHKANRLCSAYDDILLFTKNLKDAISKVPSRFHYHNSQHIKRGMKFP